MPEFRDYAAPSWFDTLTGEPKAGNTLLNRMKELKQAGQDFIESFGAYDEISRSLDILTRDNAIKPSAGMSTISINKCKKEMRELVACISNLRPMEQASTGNQDMRDSVIKLNKVCKHWWINTFADLKYRECAQYACGLGTGYMWPWWDNNFYGDGRGDIGVVCLGPSSVLPVMVTDDFDLQKAYAVTVTRETPLHLIQANYPANAHLVTPTNDFPGWIRRFKKETKRAVNGVLGVLATPQKPTGARMPSVEVNYTWIWDQSVNNTGREIPMGRPGTSWYYVVHYIGQVIDSGFRDPRGTPIPRTCTAEDCKMFPLRRLVIWTEDTVLYNDTATDLHGRVPLVQMRFDDYPWDFLGYSIVHDTWKIQRSKNRLLRVMEDSAHCRLEPPMAIDENFSQGAGARINTRRPGGLTAIPMAMGDPLKPLLPPAYYDIPEAVFKLLGFLDDQQDSMALVKDLMALAKAKQVPSADSIEKIMEMAGSVPQDIARRGEKVTCDFARLWYPMALQHYGTRRLIQVLGNDGVTMESVDLTPGELIPSHLPGEDKSKPSNFQTWERCRYVIDQMDISIEPYSQASVSRIGRALVLLQMKKAGMPIDSWTIAKSSNIDLGPEPEGTSNVYERWIWEQEAHAQLAKELQEAMGGPGAPGQQGRGRPNSNQRPPSVKQKDGGTRSTVTTSR